MQMKCGFVPWLMMSSYVYVRVHYFERDSAKEKKIFKAHPPVWVSQTVQSRLPDDWPSVVHATPNLYRTKIDSYVKNQFLLTSSFCLTGASHKSFESGMKCRALCIGIGRLSVREAYIASNKNQLWDYKEGRRYFLTFIRSLLLKMSSYHLAS